jgi:hypothetical protein
MEYKMKKYLTILFASLFIFFLMTNHNYAQFKMKVGPALGMNLNIGSGDASNDTYSGVAILLGGQVDMNFTPMIGLIANVNFYDNKSHSNTNTQNDVTTTQDVSVSYLQIQPLFKLSIPKSSFYFFAGPGVGFNIQGSTKITQTQGNADPVVQKSTLKNVSTTRFEIKAGAGFDINFSQSVALAPEFSFAYGLTDVFTNSAKTWKIMTFNLSTIVKFSVM